MELEKNKEHVNVFAEFLKENKDDKDKINKYKEEILHILLKDDEYEEELILILINIFVLKNSLE